jgi:hypothetical protein
MVGLHVKRLIVRKAAPTGRELQHSARIGERLWHRNDGADSNSGGLSRKVCNLRGCELGRVQVAMTVEHDRFSLLVHD